MTRPFTYRIQFIPTGEYYYGVRYAMGCDPSDLWTKYFTSSKRVKNLIRKYGKDKFEIQIRKVFTNAKDAILWEHRVNRHTKYWPNYLNESDAKHQGSKYSSIGGLSSKEQRLGVHDPNKLWMNDPVKKEAYSVGHRRGGARTGAMPWWNNGTKDTKSVICPGIGWSAGMLPKGTYWNNGREQRVSHSSPGEGWILGGITKTTNGRKWWNNGNEQRMAFKQPGPEWMSGKLQGSSNWWNNGFAQKRQKTSPGVDWSRGMLQK